MNVIYYTYTLQTVYYNRTPRPRVPDVLVAGPRARPPPRAGASLLLLVTMIIVNTITIDI